MALQLMRLWCNCRGHFPRLEIGLGVIATHKHPFNHISFKNFSPAQPWGCSRFGTGPNLHYRLRISPFLSLSLCLGTGCSCRSGTRPEDCAHRCPRHSHLIASLHRRRSTSEGNILMAGQWLHFTTSNPPRQVMQQSTMASCKFS